MVPALDPLWHTFLLFTKDYQRFCQTLGVPFIHHQPFDDAVDRDKVEHKYQQFAVPGGVSRDVWPGADRRVARHARQMRVGVRAAVPGAVRDFGLTRQ